MSDVSIAPASLLGKRNQSQTSFVINQQPHLPLGDNVAIVKDMFNDDEMSTDYKSATIADSVERNKVTNEQTLNLITSTEGIGKKSPQGPKHIHDVTTIVNFTKKNDDRMTMDEYNHAWTSRFNLTATPFVTAEPIFPEIMNT